MGWEKGGRSHVGGKSVRGELGEQFGDLPNQAQTEQWLGMQTSASLKDILGRHALGMCISLNSTMSQCNTAHVSLTHYMEAENTMYSNILWSYIYKNPRSWKRELLREDGDSETHKSTFQRGRSPACAVGLGTDKHIGELLDMVLAYSLLGGKGSSGFHERGGLSAGVFCHDWTLSQSRSTEHV